MTCSGFPLEHPTTIAAAFDERVFCTSAATAVWVDLLYALEKEVEDWEECRPHPASRDSQNPGRIVGESRIVLITGIKTMAQFHRALELLLGTASALVSMTRNCG